MLILLPNAGVRYDDLLYFCACVQAAVDSAMLLDRLHPYRAEALSRLAMCAAHIGSVRSAVLSMGQALLQQREVCEVMMFDHAVVQLYFQRVEKHCQLYDV